MFRYPSGRQVLVFSCLIAGAGLVVGDAKAHSTFETQQAAQNSTYKAVLRVPHGCGGEATLAVRITIPAGIIAVKPMPKPGWTLKTTTGEYGRSYALYGKNVTSGVKEIVWSGGALPDDQYDEFVFQARITDSLPAGETVFIPVVQDCATGKAAWTEIPAKGQDAHALKSPAPGILIVAATKADGHDHGAMATSTGKDVKVGALVIAAPWARATPGGARVGGGYMTITNTGKEPDRLIGGSAEIAGIFELHEMKMEGNVMKMRALEKGIEINPGQTIEFRPGGYHVMFIDLKRGLKQGDIVKGELVFEKAGRVAVAFKVESRGAKEPAGTGHDTHGSHGGKMQ
jgi:periplasmic copper chaperone A